MNVKGKTPAENTAEKQRGRPFAKGRSGNPSGKPAGARHRVTMLAEKLLDADAEAIVAAVITAAKSGDMVAARLVMDRIAPPRKGALIQFKLPPIDTAADLPAALAAIIRSVCEGRLTPDEAATITGLLDACGKAIYDTHLYERLRALEQRDSGQ